MNIFKKLFNIKEKESEELDDLKSYINSYGKSNSLISYSSSCANVPNVLLPPSTSGIQSFSSNIGASTYGISTGPTGLNHPNVHEEEFFKRNIKAEIKAELKEEIVTEVFEEIFKQLLDADIMSQKEMKEKLSKIMERMGYK